MGEVNYLTWEDFLMVASEATGREETELESMANRGLAESALLAPAAGFGDFEQFPAFREKTAVLLERLAKNHALPDGNKRTALLAAIYFAHINGYDWEPPQADENDGAETYAVVLAVAQNNVELAALADWVGQRLVPLFGGYDPAEVYPEGREENWRRRLVGQYTYADGHVMAEADFQEEWRSGLFPGTDQTWEEIERYENGAVLYVTAWIDAILKLRDFEVAWPLFDDEYRLSIVQEWIIQNEGIPAIRVFDRDELANALAGHECIHHFLWPRFAELHLETSVALFADLLPSMGFLTKPRTVAPGYELVILARGTPKTFRDGDHFEQSIPFLVHWISANDGWRDRKSVV